MFVFIYTIFCPAILFATQSEQVINSDISDTMVVVNIPEVITNHDIDINIRALFVIIMLEINISWEQLELELIQEMARSETVDINIRTQLVTAMLRRNIALGDQGDALVQGMIRNQDIHVNNRAQLVAIMFVRRNIPFDNLGRGLSR